MDVDGQTGCHSSVHHEFVAAIDGFENSLYITVVVAGTRRVLSAAFGRFILG